MANVKMLPFALAFLCGVITQARAATQAPQADGAALYLQHCSACHEGAVPRAPHVISFNTMSVDAILDAMNNGPMQAQASKLSPAQRQRLAMHLAGSTGEPARPPLACDRQLPPIGDDPWAMRGWGGDARNSRHVSGERSLVSAANVNKLTLKWVFAYPGATRARSQPLVHDGTVFVGSQDGTVFALDLNTGCAYWTYDAGAEVRSSLSLGRVPGRTSPVLFMGDFQAQVHAVDAHSGQLLWRSAVGEHRNATITGSPTLHGDRLYVPLSSSEWAAAADPGYACCTFRGAVVALDITDGSVTWRTHVIPQEPRDSGEQNDHGAARFGPAGAPVWNSPTIDEKRGLLYVGTGEAYTSPAAATSDAVIAMRLDTGAIAWTRQLLAGDAWNMSCFIGNPTNCPEEDGPDLDIGAATILWPGEKGDLLLVGQKSGDVYALDPEAKGEVLWHNKVGRGGFAGGVHWGMSASPDALFVAIADTNFTGRFSGERRPGMHRLNPGDGSTVWYTPATDVCTEDSRPLCDPGMSAAVTSNEELVFAGAFDGRLKIYDARSGEILWVFNTKDKFDAVDGGFAHGGSIESDGPVLWRDHVLVNSGYQFGGRMGGNALLVFSLDSDGATAPEEQAE